MTRRRRLITTAIALIVTVGVGVTAPGALRAQEDLVDPTGVDAALVAVGAGDVPEPLRERLRELLRWAQDGDAWPPGPVEVPVSPSQWAERLQGWRDVAPDWREAAEGFASRRQICRDGFIGPTVSAGVPPCGRLLAAELRMRHAERLIAHLGERIGEAEALAEPARTRVLSALDAVRERAMDRLRELDRDRDPLYDEEPELDRDRIRTRLAELDGLGPPGGSPTTGAPGSTIASSTTSPATSSPETSSPATSSPATSAPATSGPATSGPATSGPASTAPGTTAAGSGGDDDDAGRDRDDDRSQHTSEVES